MKRLACICISVFIGCAAFAGSPPPQSTPDSLALVELLRLSELFSAIANEQSQRSLELGKLTARQLGCLRFRPADFTREFADVAVRQLTPEEISTAVAYLRSNDGGKFAQMFAAALTTKGDRTDPASYAEGFPQFSASEAAAFARFEASSAGKKLSETSMLMNTDDMNELVGTKVKGRIAECKGATEAIEPSPTPARQSTPK